MNKDEEPLERPLEKPRISGYTLIMIVITSLSGFLMGFNSGIMNSAMDYFPSSTYRTATDHLKLPMATSTFFAIVGSLIGGVLSERYGRRIPLGISALAFLMGSLICTCAPHLIVLLIGRIFSGFALGLSTMIVPLYIAETAPTYLRGTSVSWFQLSIAFGFVVANLASGVFATADPYNLGWRLMFAYGILPAVLNLVGAYALKETPRYLYKRGDEQGADDVLSLTYGGDDEWIKYDKCIIMEAIRADTEENIHHCCFVIKRIWKTPHVRRTLIIGSSLQIFQQFVGINTVLYYASRIIRGMGVKDDSTNLYISAGIAAIQVIGTFAPVILVERMGRRLMLILSMLALMISLLGMGAAYLEYNKNSPKYDMSKRTVDLFNGMDDIDEYKDHCVTMKNCDDCITSDHCGHCHAIDDIDNGQCLPVSKKDPTLSSMGRCRTSKLTHIMSSHQCKNNFTTVPLVVLVVYLLAFAFGMGVMPWLYNAEIYPLWARSTCAAISTATNWTMNLIVSYTYLLLVQSISKHGAFFLYAGITAIGLPIIFLFVPETKHLALEEIEHLFKVTSKSTRNRNRLLREGGSGGSGSYAPLRSKVPKRSAKSGRD